MLATPLSRVNPEFGFSIVCPFFLNRLRKKCIIKEFHLNLTHLEMRMRQSGHYKGKTRLTPEQFFAFMGEKIAGLDMRRLLKKISCGLSVIPARSKDGLGHFSKIS